MFNKAKFENLILYLIRSFPDQTLKGLMKLAKLLYFADFDYFEVYEAPISGATYRAIQMGPYPDELDNVLHEMESKHILEISKEDIGRENDVTVFKLGKKADATTDTSLFSEAEIKVLDSVCRRYKELSGTDLGIVTHNEAPYNSVNLGEVIPYEMSFYRGKEGEIVQTIEA